MISVSQLTKDALSLPPEDRIRLALQLWESVHPGDKRMSAAEEEEMIQEALRRDADMDSGRVQGIPHEEVMAMLRKKFG